ncbi:outer membrane beta-barrel protein [Treponema sp.]|uniref:outer membrane beta-barrel protein n=1 Tax=Treponema sp. TaxID=166 RepID=UPI0025F86985|nr:outer membrane beta-barrel protein [Treponema sp.]MCR5217835.1 PorT family protein [Treponema sp.]
MKKFIALALGMALAVSSVTAERISTIGVRGDLSFSVGSELGSDIKDVYKSFGVNLDPTTEVGGGVTLLIKNTFSNNIVLQGEFGFAHNVVGFEGDGVEMTFSCNTLNFAALFGYDFLLAQNTVALTPFVGIQAGYILGDCDSEVTVSGTTQSDSGSVDSISLSSLLFGVEALVSVGPGHIVLDGRYNLGLFPVRDDDSDIATFRALQLGAGYSWKLN